MKTRRFGRINNVPWLWLKDLKEALLAVTPRQGKSRVLEIFGPAKKQLGE